MPLPDTECVDCSASCTTLYEVVHSVAQVAYDAVACQLTPTACDNFTGFVSHAEPHHPNADYVAAWIARIYPRDRNQNTSAGLMFPLMMAEIGIKLVESGYPTIGSEGPPTFGQLDNAAIHSYSHAESMIRRIFANVGKGSQNRFLRDCGWSGMSALTPIAPSGGIVGWTVTVSLTVP